jgi:hypothetical protein
LHATPDEFQAFFLPVEEWSMAGEEEKDQGKGFTVQDRRRFTDSGDVKADDEKFEAAAAAEAASAAAPRAAAEPEQSALPAIDFSTFVISLSTQALMHLGEIANPLTGKVEADVPVAKQMIDIISMLREKTKGNLNATEDRLMEDLLFDLRMKFVEAVKKK